ncbi:unnamed protein product, partial [Linum tenue]
MMVAAKQRFAVGAVLNQSHEFIHREREGELVLAHHHQSFSWVSTSSTFNLPPYIYIYTYYGVFPKSILSF